MTTPSFTPCWRALLSACVVAAMGCAGAAQAQQRDRQDAFALYLEGGRTLHDQTSSSMATVGVRVPTRVKFWGDRLSLSIDAYVSDWHQDPLPGARTNFLQLGVVPMFRYRFDGGQSPWFVDAGVGASYLTHDYRTREKSFGTRWNFSDHLGLGRNFGADHRHELGVYLKHVSNGGVSNPNPGETFLLLRYGYAL